MYLFIFAFSRLTLAKANRGLPTSGSLEDHLTFLSSLRKTCDSIVQRRSSISHELHTAHEVAKLQELRLAHATNTLNALEDAIGEVRARFRARGVPLYSPQDGHRTSDTVPDGTPSERTVTSSSNAVEEVSVSSPSQTCTLLTYHRFPTFSQILRPLFYVVCRIYIFWCTRVIGVRSAQKQWRKIDGASPLLPSLPHPHLDDRALERSDGPLRLFPSAVIACNPDVQLGF